MVIPMLTAVVRGVTFAMSTVVHCHFLNDIPPVIAVGMSHMVTRRTGEVSSVDSYSVTAGMVSVSVRMATRLLRFVAPRPLT